MPSVFEGLTQETTQAAMLARLDGTSGPVVTADGTGPLVPLDRGGVDIAPGAEVEVVPGVPGRVKVIVVHTGTTGRLWVGLGQTATDGVGLPLGPGGALEEFLSCAVRVRNAGAESARVSWQGFGL